jgi:hypothetical protein
MPQDRAYSEVETCISRRYARWGVSIGLVYMFMQLAIFWLYYFASIPASWFEALISGMPWLEGIRSIGTLNVVGDRLSFCLAIAYLPFFGLGVFTVFREICFRSSSWPIRKKWQDALSILFLACALFGIHYLAYWQKTLWRDSPNFMHGIAAAVIPFFLGYAAFGLLFRLRKLFERRGN